MFNNPFSQREKDYIIENKDKMTRGAIAKELSLLYPEDNDGKERDPRSIANFISDYNQAEAANYTKATFDLHRRHKERFAREGMTPQDVSKLLNALFDDHFARRDAHAKEQGGKEKNPGKQAK
jgi:hypothetical protein